MKLLNFLLLTLVLVYTNAWSQQDPWLTEFENAPTDKALLLFLESNEPPERSVQMMRSTLRHERYDLLSLIFKEHYGFSKALDAIKELPSSSIKDKSVLTILRTDSAFWYRPPPRTDVTNYKVGVQFANAVEPFLGVINKYFPSLAINEELFSTKKRRLELADQLENRMNGDVSQFTTPPKGKHQFPTGDSESIDQEILTNKDNIVQNPKEEESILSFNHTSQAVLVIVVIILIAIIWGFRRKALC